MKPITEYSKLTIVIALFLVFIIGAIVVNKMQTSSADRARKANNSTCISQGVDSGYTPAEVITACGK